MDQKNTSGIEQEINELSYVRDQIQNLTADLESRLSPVLKSSNKTTGLSAGVSNVEPVGAVSPTLQRIRDIRKDISTFSSQIIDILNRLDV